MKGVILIILLILAAKVGFSICAADDKTLTEKLFKGQTGTVFICEILTSDQDENGNLYSTVKIIDVIFGSVDSTIIKINTGSHNSSVGGASLPVGNEYLIYTSGEGNNFGCCSICDEWTKKVSMTESVQSELKILRQFAKIFDHKKSGKYDFYYSNGHLAATGQFKNGSATGHWKHFYENDTLKSFYDFECNIITQYSKNGFIMTESNTSENVSISKNYSIKDNGKLEYKFIDTKTDTGSFLQVYEYHDNGNLKEIHGQININIKGGSTSTGREGVYEEYYENGNLNVRGEYKKGRRIGIWTWYYEDGSYNTKYDYKDGATPQ